MSSLSHIEWTEATWNPVTGCTKISLGCKNCYAERMARRLQAMGQPNYKNGFEVTIHEHTLHIPLKWKKPRMIFVNSMGDLFHKNVPEQFIIQVFSVMNKARHHIFQILTKRSKRLLALSPKLPWSHNIWMGVSVESSEYAFRIDDLKKTGAFVKFLSFEPLLGPLRNLNLADIDWVIVGGESGPGARPMALEWVLGIKDLCEKFDIPFFFKQWGGVHRKRAGRLLEGRVWDEMPRVMNL